MTDQTNERRRRSFRLRFTDSSSKVVIAASIEEATAGQLALDSITDLTAIAEWVGGTTPWWWDAEMRAAAANQTTEGTTK